MFIINLKTLINKQSFKDINTIIFKRDCRARMIIWGRWRLMIWKNCFVFIFSVQALGLDSSVQSESGACYRCCWSWGREISSLNMPSVDLSQSLTCLESPASVAPRVESEDWAQHWSWYSSPLRLCLTQTDPGNSRCLCSIHREDSVPT